METGRVRRTDDSKTFDNKKKRKEKTTDVASDVPSLSEALRQTVFHNDG